MPSQLANLAGIALILLLAVGLSTARRRIRLRVVGAAFALQLAIAFAVLRTDAGHLVIGQLAGGVGALLTCADKGTEFLFGPPDRNPFANSFALGALPVIIFFASLVSLLYHLGVMQRIIRWIGGAIGLITGISKVEALGATANIFVGQSESPLVVQPYLPGLAPARLFTLMTVGMAGVAGTILAAYAGVLGREYLPYLLAASFMSAPGGILMAKLIMPDDGADPAADATPGLDELTPFEGRERSTNVIEAIAHGAQTGVRLVAAVAAMVLAFVALMAMVNGLFGLVGARFGHPELSVQGLLGLLFAPVMFLLGIPWHEAGVAGGLFGTKLALNEFVAFIDLKALPADVLSPRSRSITIFSLCGFANFTSIAIQMAVIGSLAPGQRPVIARLGLRALAAASLANLMSAALAGLFIAA